MHKIPVKSDKTEYKVAINGWINYNCYECMDTGIVVEIKDDELREHICICTL